jgi:hypothetical protein
MSKHTLIATIPCGDPDLGAEVEAKITFGFVKGSRDYWNRAHGTWEQGYGPEVSFEKAEPYCNGRPHPYHGAFADLEQDHLNDLCIDWLESDGGYAEALEKVDLDNEAAQEYAAELRREA